MEDIANIKNNLSNVVYLYENFRFENLLDWITLEYAEKVPVKKLKAKLENYFLKNRSLDDINISAVQHLDLSDDDALFWSYDAFQKISDIKVNGKQQLISLKYNFLSSMVDAIEALELLENDQQEEFMEKYPNLNNEMNLFNETNYLILISNHVSSSIVRIKSESEG